jgi:receptor expression-enhancing protein 5/6
MEQLRSHAVLVWCASFSIYFSLTSPIIIATPPTTTPISRIHIIIIEMTRHYYYYEDKLRELEKKTGQPKVYFFLAIVAILSSIIYALGGMKLTTDLFAFVYPAYCSFVAIESAETIDDTQWLTYWVVFALFSITENVMNFLVEYIPFYYMIKCAFFLWLYHPKFLGAGVVYKSIIK